MNKIIAYILAGFAVLVLIAVGIWFFFLRPTPTEQTSTSNAPLGIGTSQTVEVTPETTNEQQTSTNTTQSIQQKVFKVVSEPVVGAAIVQYAVPTTTVARYVQQNNGHIFDLVLDSSGAVPKAISNTTIPGIKRVLWTQKGEGVILQYLDDMTVKTVALSFPDQTASTTQPVNIKFLPDSISAIVVSPDGSKIAYLLRTETGVRGYIAAADGTGSSELFTLPLKEVVLVWPSQSTLLAYTKSALGVPGISFSISISSGAVVPLLYAQGITLTADPTYSYLVYQTNIAGEGPSTYVRSLDTGGSSGLSFNPYPERCVWGSTATTTLYCATPLTYVSANYLDLWHAGSATAADALIEYTLPSRKSSILAVPGGDAGGVDSTIDSITVSPDEKYLLFVRRGDRSLWGVRLNETASQP